MKLRRLDATIFSENCSIEVMDFTTTDGAEWKRVFDLWKGLKMGMRDYKSREPNFPEGLSEVAFCLWSGSSRLINSRGLSNTSFDTVNTNTMRTEQIKACSVEYDLTSFGPRSRWDDLFFLDFYNNNNVDGHFDVYKVPNDLIYDHRVNATQTLAEQQAQGRRPRFSLKRDLIARRGLTPVARNVQVW
jgi:hypothetical protein